MRPRPVSIDLHSGLELLVGLALIGAPFALGLPGAAIAFSVAVGSLLVGLSLSATEPGGRASIPLRAHAAYDWGFGVGLIAAGIAFGLAYDAAAFAFFAAAGSVELLLSATTHYAPSRA